MRISIQLSLAALLLGLCAPGCNKKNPDTAAMPAEKSPVMNAPAATTGDKVDSTIAASVDGVTLSRDELMQQVQAVLAARQVPEDQLPMAMQYIAPRMVNDFVSKTLLLGEVKRMKLALDAADRAKYMQPLEEMAAKQGTTVAELIKKAPMGEKKVLQELDEQFLIEKFIDTQIRSKIKLDDKAVDAAIAEGNTKAGTPETVQASHILIQTPATLTEKERAEKRAQIDDIRAQLLTGTNFETLARDRSDCPSGKQAGGALGAFARNGSMVKPFEDAAFAQKIGEIGPVVETKFGFHVIKVTAHNEAKAATREEVRKELENEQIGNEIRTCLTALRSKAKITTMFDNPGGMPGAMPGGMPGAMPDEDEEEDAKAPGENAK